MNCRIPDPKPDNNDEITVIGVTNPVWYDYELSNPPNPP